eukprot:6492792-Amphidinium_carterae.3
MCRNKSHRLHVRPNSFSGCKAVSCSCTMKPKRLLRCCLPLFLYPCRVLLGGAVTCQSCFKGLRTMRNPSARPVYCALVAPVMSWT